MKTSVNLTGLFAILFALCFSSLVTADGLDSSVTDRLTLFGAPDHDDSKATIGLMKNSDPSHTEADSYELICGKKGRYTTFCKNLPYQFYCNPDTGKGSVRVSNLLCSLVCSCKKVSAIGAGPSLDNRSKFDAVVFENQVNRPIDLSALPQCAKELLPAIYRLKCPSGDWTACVCNNKSFIQNQCNLMQMQCSPEDAQVAIKFAQAVCGEVDAQIRCDIVAASKREELTTNALSARGSTDLHMLEPRHDYAMVCDGSKIGASHQRLRTIDCQKKYGYSCTLAGRLVSRKDDIICTVQCRCVNTRPRCDKYLNYKGYSKDDTSWVNCVSTGLNKVAAENSITPELIPDAPQKDSAVATDQIDAFTVDDSLDKRAETLELPNHQLERRHNYAFACDIDTEPRDARRYTRWCEVAPRSYSCLGNGRLTWVLFSRWCSDHCRCASLNPRPIIPCPGIGIGVSICGDTATSETGDGSEVADTSESLEAEGIPDDIDGNSPTLVKRETGLESSSDSADATKIPTMLCPGNSALRDLCAEVYHCTAFGLARSNEDIPIEQCEQHCGCVDTRQDPPQHASLIVRELGNPYISPPDPDPNMAPFIPWCSDADSVRDPLRTGNCIHLWKYTCNGLGELLTSRPREECELACVCVQEPKDSSPQLEARADVSTNDVTSLADVPETHSGTGSANDAMWAGLNQPPSGNLAEPTARDSHFDSMDTSAANANSERRPLKYPDITYDSPFSNSQWENQDMTQDHPPRLEKDSPFSASQWGNQEDGRAGTELVKPSGEVSERGTSTLMKCVKAADPTDVFG